MPKNENSDTTVLVPGGLTDLAKALRELIGALKDLGGLTQTGFNLYRRHQAAKRSGDLATLAFRAGGMIEPLKRIANGSAEVGDFELLQRLVGDTADEVQQKVFALHNYRDVVRVHLGMEGLNRFDDLLHGPSGKFQIRYAINGLISKHNSSPRPKNLDRHAGDILNLIERFNNDLARLHDLIYPPKGAPK